MVCLLQGNPPINNEVKVEFSRKLYEGDLHASSFLLALIPLGWGNLMEAKNIRAGIGVL
jgi:hypothetical protein